MIAVPLAKITDNVVVFKVATRKLVQNLAVLNFLWRKSSYQIVRAMTYKMYMEYSIVCPYTSSQYTYNFSSRRSLKWLEDIAGFDHIHSQIIIFLSSRGVVIIHQSSPLKQFLPSMSLLVPTRLTHIPHQPLRTSGIYVN